MLKVAIDNNPLISGHKVRGVGRYTTELINSLKKESDKGINFFAVNFSRANLDKYDVIHIPFFNPIKSRLPQTDLKKVVVTIHDLIPLIYPKIYQAGVSGYLNLIKQKKLLRKVASVVVPSETSKKDVVRLLGIPSEKIRVVYESHKSTFRKIVNKNWLGRLKYKYKLPSKFALYVGDVNYNKNIPTLIDACNFVGIDVVICGKQALDLDDFGLSLMNLKGPRDWLRFLFNKPHPEVSHHGVLGDQFRANKNVHRLGYVSDRDLVGIYNLASVYVQSSFYEGFGLSVIEAMACGTPVVVSKTNALTEIAGGAALIADPKNSKDFSRKIKTTLINSEIRRSLIEKGFVRSGEFSWEKAAKETIEVYKTMVNS